MGDSFFIENERSEKFKLQIWEKYKWEKTF